MAGSKQDYTMAFRLNAQLNGGFSGTFSKAQAEFSRLGAEIRTLERLQKDISGYQKQQSAMSSTELRLERLTQRQELLKEQMKMASANAMPVLQQEYLKLEQKIGDTVNALERQRQKLAESEKRLKEAGVDTANLAQKDQELTAKIKELKQEQEKAGEAAQTFGEKAAEGFTAAGAALAAAGITAGVKAMYDAFLDCVGAAGSLEEAMSTVEALSGASALELAELTAKAKELGAATKFTAKESADAMGYMAMAGWDAVEMLQGMDGVLQLAAASGEDLAQVSDIVTDSLSAFGLTAADTAHFSDVLAAAATNANTNVSIMGETFKMSASVAGALGYSIEDVATAVGLMANSGVKGTIAGTALRNTFNGLLEGVTLTSAAFGEYEYSAVRADGTMKSFGDTVEELRQRFAQMSEAERVSNAMAIAGQRGYNGLLAVLNATDESYASLTQSIQTCDGAARRMAEIKLDNLNGQLTLMNSAWDALRTTVGEQFLPELRGLAEVGTDVLVWMDGFVQRHPALVKGVMTFTGALGGLTVAVTGVSAALKVFQALNMAALFTGPVGAVLAGTAVLAGLAGAVAGLVSAANDGVPTVKELTEAARDLREAMDEAAETYEQTANQSLAAAEAAGVYIDRLDELEAAGGRSAENGQEYQNVLALLLRTMPELSDSIRQTTDEYGRASYTLETSTEELRKNTEELRRNAQARAYQEYINALYDRYGDVMLEAAENSIRLTQAQTRLDTAQRKYNETQARMTELAREAAEQDQLLPAEYDELSMVLHQCREEMDLAEKEIRNLSAAAEVDADAVAAAQEEISQAEEAVRSLTGVTQAQTEAEAEAARQTEELAAAMTPVRRELEQLTAAYQEAYDEAKASIEGQYALWDQAAEAAAVSAGSINAALESQAAYWRDYNANLETLTERAGNIEGLQELAASFADGSKESVNAIAGMAKASDKELAAMVENWKALQAQQAETAESLAELVTDLPAQLEEMQTAMQEGVEGMELPDTARTSARGTIQAFIDEASNLLPAVQQAYRQAGLAAAEALGIGIDKMGAGGEAPAVNSISAAEASLTRARRTPAVILNAHARGTTDAEDAFIAGEHGPELILGMQGATVFPARETQRIVEAVGYSGGAGGSIVLTVAPVYQIDGGMDADRLEAVLEANTARVKELALEALREAREDAVRGAYT